MHLKIILPIVLLLLVSGAAHTAFAGTVELQSIQIVPVEILDGEFPEITGIVKSDSANAKATGETMEIIVFATLTRPDHAVKLWTWKKIRIKAGESQVFSIPKEYEMKLKGVYKVDFSLYSKDMRPLNKLSKSFTVVEPPHPPIQKTSEAVVTDSTGTLSGQPLVQKTSEAVATDSTGTLPGKASDHNKPIGVGVYVNTVNSAVGAIILLWPLKYVGFQGSYTMGEFTTAEVRLLARLPLSAGINPYLGVGYASVTTERTVDTIGMKPTFTDSGMSGVIGVEIPVRRSLFGYVEISNTAVDLKKEVTSGGRTGTATVKYSPFTVGFGIVYYAF